MEIMGKMKNVKDDLGYGQATPTKVSSSTTQLESDNTYLKGDYDPSW